VHGSRTTDFLQTRIHEPIVDWMVSQLSNVCPRYNQDVLFRIALTFVMGTCLIGDACAQSKMTPLPADHWVFKRFKELKRAGLLHGMEKDLADGRAPFLGRGVAGANRYNVAMGAYGVVTLLQEFAQTLDSECASIGHMPAGSAATTLVDKANHDLKVRNSYVYGGQVVVSIIDFAAPQLKELGADAKLLKQQVHIAVAKLERIRVPNPGSDLVQFADVSPSHWGASAILDMRRLGLIAGYPIGTFQSP